MARFVSRKEAALELGVSRQYVEKLIRLGKIVETADGIDIDATKATRDQTTDPTRRMAAQQVKEIRAASAPLPSRPGTPLARDAAPADAGAQIVMSFTDARTAREVANAQLAELKYAEQSGRLIPRDQVTEREFAIARKLRDRILGFPTKLQQFVTPEAMKMLTSECDALIRELQEDAARIAQ